MWKLDGENNCHPLGSHKIPYLCKSLSSSHIQQISSRCRVQDRPESLAQVKNILIERLSLKLDWQICGLYRINKKIGKVAYRLDLPASLQIHSVFHISLLRDHQPRVGKVFPEP